MKQSNDIEQYSTFHNLSLQYKDSLYFIQKNTQRDHLEYIPINISLKNAENIKQEQSNTIVVQKRAIFYLIAMLVIAVIALGGLLLLHFKLRKTQKTLALKTKQIIESEIKHSSEANIDSQLIQLFEERIIETKLYLSAKVSLSETAEILESNRSYVSRMINRNYGMSFSDYINNLRVNEACRIMLKNNDPNFTLDHLYAEVGFTGKSTFYIAFKKFTGVTPAAFQKIQSTN